MRLAVLIIYLLSFCFVSSSAANSAGIAVVFSSNLEPYRQTWNGFKEVFDEKNITLNVSEYYVKQQDAGSIIRQIVKKNPDIVFTIGATASKLVKTKHNNTPVVFSMVLNSEEILNSNTTGTSLDIHPKSVFGGISRIFPNVKRIGIIYSPGSTSVYEEISKASNKTGFQIIAKMINSNKEFPHALAEVSQRIDLFLMIPDAKIYFSQSIRHLLIEGLRKKFPVVGLSSYHTKAGALISFESDYKELGKQAGEIAVRILEGENPSDIPPSRPRKVNFTLNLLVAKRLGITISDKIVKQASGVFGK